MTHTFKAASFLVVCTLVTSLHAQDASGDVSDGNYVSDASRIVGTYQPASREHSPQAMAKSAQAFLESLDDELRQRATLALDHQERREWTNLPAREGAGGVRLGDCNEKQVTAMCDLMATLFSEQGYAKMCNIMLADDQLLEGGRPRSGFGTEKFSIVIFGKPAAKGRWAFLIDGHHVGVNLAIQGRKLTMSPSFIGTQPEAYHIADEKFRPLAGEIDGAYRLVNSLSDTQRKQAVVGSKRGRIKTGPGNDAKVPKPEGVSCGTFNESQKEMLLSLIAEWVNDLPRRQARARMRKLKGEVDEMRFAWNGSTDAGSDVSYTIQGPSLIIEYACQDLGGNPLNHLHSMYRDPTNEYGKQLDN
jgi:hypothetical protein